MIFRILVLALLIFWGVWVFQSCEYQGDNGTNVNVEEVERDTDEGDNDSDDYDTEEEENDDEDEKDSMKEALMNNKSDKEEERVVVEVKDIETAKEEEVKAPKVSIIDKMFGRDDKKTEKAEMVEQPADSGASTIERKVTTMDMQPGVGSMNDNRSGSWVAPVETQAMMKAKNAPDRDTYVRLYVYENRIDSFGDAARTGRVHFEVINMTNQAQTLYLPKCDLKLGKVEAGGHTFMGFEPDKAGQYMVVSKDIRGSEEISIGITE